MPEGPFDITKRFSLMLTHRAIDELLEEHILKSNT